MKGTKLEFVLINTNNIIDYTQDKQQKHKTYFYHFTFLKSIMNH